MIGTSFRRQVVRFVGLAAVLVASLLGVAPQAFAQGAPDCRPYPGAAYFQGAGGTFWGADFVLTNPHTEPVSGVIVYTPRDVQRGTGQDLEIHYYLSTKKAWYIQNIVESLLNGENAVGVLCVKPDSGSLEPVGRLKSYNYNPDDASLGRYGQTLEQEEWTYPDGTDIFTIGDARERTNVLVVTGPAGAVLSVDSYSPGGTKIDTYTHYLDPDRYYQWSGVGDATGAELFANVSLEPNGTLVVRNVGGSAIIWGSVVNNVVGDGYTPRFNNVDRGDVPEPTNEPPYLTCIRNLWDDSEFCDINNDGTVDTVINPSSNGPPPFGPENYELVGIDPDGDAIAVNCLGVPAIPSYVSLDGLNISMDPEEGNIGESFDLICTPSDGKDEGSQLFISFLIIS
jgi:hypothetical protein